MSVRNAAVYSIILFSRRPTIRRADIVGYYNGGRSISLWKRLIDLSLNHDSAMAYVTVCSMNN